MNGPRKQATPRKRLIMPVALANRPMPTIAFRYEVVNELAPAFVVVAIFKQFYITMYII